MTKRRFLAAIALLAFVAAPAAAQVTGRIVGPGATKLWVAVAPLAGEPDVKELGEEFAKVLERNLGISGYFRIVERGAHLEGAAPTSKDEINFANWRVLGTQALVKGRIESSGDTIRIEARLFDVGQQRQLGGKDFDAPKGEIRRLARKFADAILEMLTGERGPFDSWIAFASRRGGRAKEIHVMSVDGLDRTQITSNGTINLAPSWHPDRGSLLFTSYQDGNPSLYAFDMGGRTERKISSSRGLNLGGRWSPDGGKIVVSLERGGETDLYLIHPDGRLLQRLSHGSAIEVSPTWSPDGQQIAFVSDRAGGPQIYVMNADGSGVRRVTFEGNYNTSPTWSPKGNTIAYTTQKGGFHIHVLDLESRRARRVATGEDPSFSPDGRYLVYSSKRSGKPTLVLTDLGGTHEAQLTPPGGDDTSPAWSSRVP